jgi:amino acid transporter
MFTYLDATEAPVYSGNGVDAEKGHQKGVMTAVEQDYVVQDGSQRELKRTLKGRHMQMIAIGGAIGAGFFVGSGGALSTGGPGSLVIGFMCIRLNPASNTPC